MPITLISRVKRPQIFHLPQGKDSVRMNVTRAHHLQGGEVALKEQRLTVPATVTLLAEGRLENQPDELERTEEVQAALMQGALRIVPYQKKPAARGEAAKPVVEESDGGRGRKARGS